MRLRAMVLVFQMIPLLLAPAAPHASQAAPPGDSVVLITIDGARTEEIFGGLDLDVLKSTLKEGQKVEESPAYRRFWGATPEERRRKLMPFFWSLVTEQGSIAGDRRLGSAVSLGNTHRFSYPGYAEILLGEPHDDVIRSTVR
jgi:hypothetical protein